MALFSPEFLVGVLLAFLQLRLRSYCSLATYLVNGLTFFLPPEDELIATLNGSGKGSKPKPGVSTGQPLSPTEKMQAFYVRCAKTEPGVFSQTLFFELYEMLVVLVSSAWMACLAGDALAFLTPWIGNDTSSETVMDSRADVATYGLVSALLVALWFPLQLHVAQGLGGYETRLGLAMGFVGFVASGFVLLAPKGLLDFDLELAAQLAGSRVALVLRTVGFTDADLLNVTPLAEMAKVTLFLTLAGLAAVFTCTTFLPAFRFARMYTEMTKDAQTSRLQKLLLHLNMLLPVLVCALWIPRLSSDVLVPSELVKCSPRSLTRDCLQSDVLGLSSASSPSTWKWYSLSESQFHALRVYVVLLVCLIRLLCFRAHLQFFLLEPREAMAGLVGRPGPVDGPLLQSKVRLQFNYVPVIALQYLAPVCALLAAVELLARQTATPLGIFQAASWTLQQMGLSIPVSLTTEGLRAASLNVLPDTEAAPNLGGFKLGDELDRDRVTLFVRGMSGFPVLTAEFYAAALGFLIWCLSFTTFVVSAAGLLYWRNVPHGNGAADLEGPAALRQNKQTPKTLKNQLKSLKLKKNK
ncbi:hypothetical protein BBJ28_00009630 [Nothophytophthora sp. Chile5]|nr:hypothetical protein BBJ28_00009630 [Nothophytophthora sp. Chile5]